MLRRFNTATNGLSALEEWANDHYQNSNRRKNAFLDFAKVEINATGSKFRAYNVEKIYDRYIEVREYDIPPKPYTCF